jgi:hypothetical protein
LVSIGLALSEEKIFEKAYDVRRTTDGRRRTPSDGNSSPVWIELFLDNMLQKLEMSCQTISGKEYLSINLRV